MNYNSAVDYLNSKLVEQRNVIVETLVQGKLAEGEYKRLCGVLQGLDFAMNLNNDLAKRMERDDE